MVQMKQRQPECILLIDVQFKENLTFFEGNWRMKSTDALWFVQSEAALDR
jgi:hypothetical protein